MNFSIRPYKSGEENYVVTAHERVYLEEYRWGSSFGDYAKKVALNFATSKKNPREELWVAETDGKLVGCILLVETEKAEIGQVRLFLVEKAYRKSGIGTALTDALLDKARKSGYKRLILWTVEPLIAARHHYAKIGFQYIKSVPNSDWSLDGETVNEEKWEMIL